MSKIEGQNGQVYMNLATKMEDKEEKEKREVFERRVL